MIALRDFVDEYKKQPALMQALDRKMANYESTVSEMEYERNFDFLKSIALDLKNPKLELRLFKFMAMQPLLDIDCRKFQPGEYSGYAADTVVVSFPVGLHRTGTTSRPDSDFLYTLTVDLRTNVKWFRDDYRWTV